MPVRRELGRKVVTANSIFFFLFGLFDGKFLPAAFEVYLKAPSAKSEWNGGYYRPQRKQTRVGGFYLNCIKWKLIIEQ